MVGVDNIDRLLTLMTGDEKHSLAVVLDPRRDPGALRARPRRLAGDGRRPAPRPVPAVEGTRPDGLLRGALRPRVLPRVVARRRGAPSTRRWATTRTATWCRASRSPPARSVTGCRSPSVRRSACARRGSPARVVVLVGDAELDEGSNHEALELAAGAGPRRPDRRRRRQPEHQLRRTGPDRGAVRHRGLAGRRPSTAATTTRWRRRCPSAGVGVPNAVVATVTDRRRGGGGMTHR